MEDVPTLPPTPSWTGVLVSLHHVIKLFIFANLVDGKWYSTQLV